VQSTRAHLVGPTVLYSVGLAKRHDLILSGPIFIFVVVSIEVVVNFDV